MVGGVFYEHGHRLVAAFVGMLTVTLVVLLSRWEPRAWVRWFARGALLVVLLQGLLGGLTVLWQLPTAVSVTHACLAQTFFCLTVVLAVCTAPGWYTGTMFPADPAQPSLRWLATGVTGVVFLQLFLGALMRHKGAGLAIADFPLAFGRLWPPMESPAVVIHFLHRLGAVLVTLCMAWAVARILRYYRTELRLRRPALLLVGLLVVQLALGALTIWTRRAIIPVTAHVAVGAAVLAMSLILTLRVYRFMPAPQRVGRGAFVSEQVTA
jgi:cytochrome c oxidase assembly protein subunit 15